MSIDVSKLKDLQQRMEQVGWCHDSNLFAEELKQIINPRLSVADYLAGGDTNRDLAMVRAKYDGPISGDYGTILYAETTETVYIRDNGTPIKVPSEHLFPIYSAPRMALISEDQPQDQRIAAYDALVSHPFFDGVGYKDSFIAEALDKLTSVNSYIHAEPKQDENHIVATMEELKGLPRKTQLVDSEESFIPAGELYDYLKFQVHLADSCLPAYILADGAQVNEAIKTLAAHNGK